VRIGCIIAMFAVSAAISPALADDDGVVVDR
jgi:hypothetical protein